MGVARGQARYSTTCRLGHAGLGPGGLFGYLYAQQLTWNKTPSKLFNLTTTLFAHCRHTIKVTHLKRVSRVCVGGGGAEISKILRWKKINLNRSKIVNFLSCHYSAHSSLDEYELMAFVLTYLVWWDTFWTFIKVESRSSEVKKWLHLINCNY